MFFKLSFITNKVMEIPFGLTGMIYGLSSIRLSMTNPEKNNKILDISMASIIILTLAAMLIINLAFPTLNQ